MPKDITKMSVDELLNMSTLGLDDTFSFRCKACGKCCKERRDIVLTAYDLFRLARYFGRTPEEIVERYCEVFEGENSHFPVLWLKPVAPDASCPFLRNKRCSVHAAKPGKCRVYPLARIHNLEGLSQFCFNGSKCKHPAEPIKVKDWIGDFATEESERAGRLWTDAMFCLTTAINPKKFICSAEERKEIINDIFIALWLPYDIKKPFTPQFERNVAALRAFLPEKYAVEIPTMDYIIQKHKENSDGDQTIPSENKITGGTEHV